MSNLRKAIIRLAHEKPELRPHLIPLLAKRAGLGMMERLQLLSAFQVLTFGTPKAMGVSRKDALAAISKITGKTLPKDAKPPVKKSVEDYMKWLDTQAKTGAALKQAGRWDGYHPEVMYTKASPSGGGEILYFDKKGELIGIGQMRDLILFKFISSEDYRQHPDQVVDPRKAAERVQDRAKLFIKV